MFFLYFTLRQHVFEDYISIIRSYNNTHEYVIAMLVLIIVYCIIKNVTIQKLIKKINKTVRD
jgi:hypothetical protein